MSFISIFLLLPPDSSSESRTNPWETLLKSFPTILVKFTLWVKSSDSAAKTGFVAQKVRKGRSDLPAMDIRAGPCQMCRLQCDLIGEDWCDAVPRRLRV